KGMRSLRILELRATQVTDTGMNQLAQMNWLDTLGLQETGIGDAGVANLRPLNETLVRLYLGYTGITDGSLDVLKSFTTLRRSILRGGSGSRTRSLRTGDTRLRIDCTRRSQAAGVATLQPSMTPLTVGSFTRLSCFCQAPAVAASVALRLIASTGSGSSPRVV